MATSHAEPPQELAPGLGLEHQGHPHRHAHPMRLIMLGTGPFAVPTLRALAAGPHEVVFTWRERVGAEQNSWQPTERDSLEIHNTSGMPRLEKAMVEGPFNDSGEREITLESTATAGM